MIKKYIEYLKDNPHGYWFKAKWFGWGWVPVKWQGWLVILVYLGVVIILGKYAEANIENEANYLNIYHILFFIFTIILVWICYKKGERPEWRWGNPR